MHGFNRTLEVVGECRSSIQLDGLFLHDRLESEHESPCGTEELRSYIAAVPAQLEVKGRGVAIGTRRELEVQHLRPSDRKELPYSLEFPEEWRK